MPAAPDLAVVVPVKGGPLAKSRLGMGRADRRDLADAFARDTVAAARAGLPDALVVVVSADAAVRAWAQAAGCVTVPDTGAGLDAAVAVGVGVAVRAGSRWVCVLLGDHPALRPAEVAEVVAALRAAAPAMVPDADGTGTAMLVAALGPDAVVPTRFGAGSATAHRALGYTWVEPDAPGVRIDVDDAPSLAAAIAVGLGAHTRRALARATLPGVQATIHREPGEGPGSALLDDGVEVQVPLGSVAHSGLLHLRAGQRVSIELDESGLVATRVWIVGIGPGETIR